MPNVLYPQATANDRPIDSTLQTYAKKAKEQTVEHFLTKNVRTRRALVENNATRYGLTKRTRVDFQLFDKNRISRKPLTVQDKTYSRKIRNDPASEAIHRTLIRRDK